MMPFLLCPPLPRLGRLLRHVWLRMLTGVVISQSPEQVRARICALPVAEQAALVGASLAGLGLASMLFAHSGPGGPAALWITLLLVCR